MKLFKTLSINTWVFPLDRINNHLWQTALASDDASNNNEMYNLALDPSVKYMYVSSNIQNKIAQGIMNGMKQKDGGKTDCTSTNLCFFDSTCDKLKELNPNSTIFSLIMKDD